MDIYGRENRQSITEKGLSGCGIPRDALRVTQEQIFRMFEDKREACVRLRRYFEGFADSVHNNVWVYIRGSKLNNRDILAGYLAKYAYSRNMDVAYVTAAELFDLYYARMDGRDSEDSYAEKEKYDSLRNKEYLVIASLGVEMFRKSNDMVLLALLEYRSDKGLPTVISSNKRFKFAFGESSAPDTVEYIRQKRFTVRIVLSDENNTNRRITHNGQIYRQNSDGSCPGT
jgi:hypothetical protein